MLENLNQYLDDIAGEKIINLADYQPIKIVSNKETMKYIRQLAQERGISISQVIEGIIKAATTDQNQTAAVM